MKRNHEQLKRKTYKLGELSLGSIQTKWKTCGDLNCKCARGEKHGPYNYLAYTDNETGKTTMMYIKESELPERKKRIRKYENFKNELRELMEIEVRMKRGQTR